MKFPKQNSTRGYCWYDWREVEAWQMEATKRIREGISHVSNQETRACLEIILEWLK